ncbi:hypothetical protein C0993_005159, partial [Termitomyces sp. T159_Od127]
MEAIRALGSADGYNTESPERLHIDLAKEVYRASNKRDYEEQMTLWLQRQEAMWIREGFCQWRKGMVEESPKSRDESAVDSDSDSDGEGKHDEQVFMYTAPFKNVGLSSLQSDFGAVDFLPALTTFIRTTLPRSAILPNQFDCFNLYKQVVVTLPPNQYIGDHILTNRIRTMPQTEPQGRKQGSPAHFDVALVVDNAQDYRELGGLS